MRTVKIRKSELIEAITKNRSIHIDEYVKASEGYRDYMVCELGKAIDRLKSGENIELRFDYDKPPKDHAKEYDTALKMLSMSVEDEIELYDSEFKSLVLDDWEWQHAWKLGNSKYIVK